MATEEEIATHLHRVKVNAYNTLVMHLNNLTRNALNTYPEAESKTWDIQKLEADALAEAGGNATLAMAPVLAMVCAAHFGYADDVTRLAQVKSKGTQVRANSGAWLPAAAYVNGLRARTQDQIDASSDAIDVTKILEASMAEATNVLSAMN